MVNALNLQELDQEQSLELCRFFIKQGQNIALFGRRGSGKTEISIQSILDSGFKVNYINLSVIERPDLAGYPDLHAEGEVVNFKSPCFLPRLGKFQKPDTVILFDEVDKASPDITAPLLEILQFKKVNGQAINAAACILTGNLSNEGAHSNNISSALLDRTAKYVLRFNFDKWIEWCKFNKIHDLIISFLVANPELACGEIEGTYYATPSPRGWTQASSALFAAQEIKMSDMETVSGIIAGFVGYEASLKFSQWYKFYRKFEPIINSLFEHGECSISYSDLSPTEKLIFCTTACHLAKHKLINSSKNKYSALETICKFFDKNKVDLEVQLLSLRNSFSGEFVTEHKLYANKIFFEKFKKIQETSLKKS